MKATKDIKVTYDKKLKKYHIQYHHLKDTQNFRYDFYKELSDQQDLFMVIETHLGSVNSPDPTTYTKTTESILKAYDLQYHIRPVQIRTGKSIFGVIGKGKPIEDFMIAFVIKKGTLTPALFEALLLEFDLQVAYGMKVAVNQIFEDYIKGYLKAFDDENYFDNHLFDSRIFEKFLATENLLQDQ